MITHAQDGNDAIDLIRNNQDSFDIVISDISIPGTNGLILTKIVKELNPSIRVVLMSSFTFVIDQIKHFQIGVETILTKPFKIEELISVIKNPTTVNEVPLANMIPVKIASLLYGIKTPTDLYVQLADEKYIKIFNAKQKIDARRLDQFRIQNIFHLYAIKEECFNLDLSLYLPTRLSNFKTNRVLNFNVFYLLEDEYRKLIPAGTMFNDRIQKIVKDYHIKTLYVADKDNYLFLDYLDEILNDYIKNKHVTADDKLATTASVVLARTHEVYLKPTRESIFNLQKSQKHLIDFLKDNHNEAIKNLIRLNDQSNGPYIHGSMVASLSYAILLEITAMRKNSEDQLKIRALDNYIFDSGEVKDILFIGALLHDLGKQILHINKISSNDIANDVESLKIIEKHPQVAFDTLSALKILHPKSLEIIIQHEEFCDGSGYPNKLKKTNISFFSQVVILANFFDNLKRKQKLNNEQAIDEIKKTPEKFNKYLILVLERVLFNKNTKD